LTDKLSNFGLYTFTVQAIADVSGLYFDGVVSVASGEKRVGGTASITFTASDKGNVLGTTAGAASIPRSNGTLTVTVTGGGGFTSFVWIVDGVVLAGQITSSVTLTGSNYSLGGHSVTVYAVDGEGKPWSPEAPYIFTVTAE
jgi:hypothetical protein